jgi:1,2-diacylglycerol-3-alpha-glucose alpha-1,2-galactosyltransferase
LRVNVVSESAFTVQGHGVHTAFIETAEALERYTDWDVVTNSNRPADVVHLHTVGPYALGKLLFAGGAKVVSAHVTPDSFVGSLVGARYWLRAASLYLKWFYNRADSVVAVSEDVASELKRMGVTAPVVVVPNTIDTKLFRTTQEARVRARKKFGYAPDDFVIVGCGQVQPRKRVDLFAEVARQQGDLKFIWVGGIPFKRLGAASGEMHKLMASPPANLKFTGLLGRNEVTDYFHAGDLFFLPSEQETFGLVIVEAAAAGMPILLRDLEQYRKTFADNYVVADDTHFAQVIRKFTKDKEYYRHWQDRAKKIALKYDLAEGAKMLDGLYKTLLPKKRGGKSPSNSA